MALTNVALNKSIITNNGLASKANLVDGNTSTTWLSETYDSQGTTTSFTVDLGAEYYIERIVLYSAYGSASVVMSFSLDNVEFIVVDNKITMGTNIELIKDFKIPIKARYVKLSHFIGYAPSANHSLKEIMIYTDLEKDYSYLDYSLTRIYNDLKFGDPTRGYFGKMEGLLTNSQLRDLAGITFGELVSPATTDITFHKFAYDGKIIFIPSLPIVKNLSPQQLMNLDLLKGKVISLGSQKFLLRVPYGRKATLLDGVRETGREWGLIEKMLTSSGSINPILPMATADFPVIATSWRICMEADPTVNLSVTARGGNVITGIANVNISVADITHVWQPVLEVI